MQPQPKTSKQPINEFTEKTLDITNFSLFVFWESMGLWCSSRIWPDKGTTLYNVMGYVYCQWLNIVNFQWQRNYFIFSVICFKYCKGLSTRIPTVGTINATFTTTMQLKWCMRNQMDDYSLVWLNVFLLQKAINWKQITQLTTVSPLTFSNHFHHLRFDLYLSPTYARNYTMHTSTSWMRIKQIDSQIVYFQHEPPNH